MSSSFGPKQKANFAVDLVPQGVNRAYLSTRRLAVHRQWFALDAVDRFQSKAKNCSLFCNDGKIRLDYMATLQFIA